MVTPAISSDRSDKLTPPMLSSSRDTARLLDWLPDWPAPKDALAIMAMMSAVVMTAVFVPEPSVPFSPLPVLLLPLPVLPNRLSMRSERSAPAPIISRISSRLSAVWMSPSLVRELMTVTMRLYASTRAALSVVTSSLFFSKQSVAPTGPYANIKVCVEAS